MLGGEVGAMIGLCVNEIAWGIEISFHFRLSFVVCHGRVGEEDWQSTVGERHVEIAKQVKEGVLQRRHVVGVTEHTFRVQEY